MMVPAPRAKEKETPRDPRDPKAQRDPRAMAMRAPERATSTSVTQKMSTKSLVRFHRHFSM